MRVRINAFFLSKTATGSGQYVSHLLRKLTEWDAENEYVLIGMQHTGHRMQDLEGLYPESCILHFVSTPFVGVSRNLSKLWFEQVSFPRLCRRAAVDVAHVPYFASPLVPTRPTVVTVHDLIPLLLPAYRGSFLVRLYTRLVAAGARRAHLVLTDSEASKRDIVRHLRIPPRRVRVVYLAADEIFRPVEDEMGKEIRHRYGLPEDYILYLGGFDQRKNIPTLLRAFARIAGTRDIRLVIAGRLPAKDTPFTPDPRRWARELGVQGRVIFTGWVAEEDKPALYSGATLFVFPSLYEGFGLPPLEALACGTPVVASDAGSLPEIVGQGGILVDPQDVEALAEAMKGLLTDETLRAELRGKALTHAARFHWDNTAQETLAAYREARLEFQRSCG